MILDLDTPDREPVRAGPEQDLARLGRLLEPRGDVDGLAGREGRLGVVDDDLAGLDADPRLEAELVDGVEDRDRCAHGSLGVVLVRLRDPEGGHDGVAGELLDDAAVGSMQCATLSKYRVTRRRTTSGSLAETSAVESTRSTKSTVASFRSTPQV